MKVIKLVAVIATLVFGISSLQAQNFKVDLSHSEIGFKVKHLMISNVKGNFSSFSGSYDLKDKKLTALEGTVDVKSVDTGIEKRDNHLRSEDFFFAEKYPQMTFKMKKSDGESVTGDLTIRGVTKEVTLEVEFNGMIEDPWGNTRSSLTLEGEINRMDYGLKWNKAIEAGGVVVGEEVKLEIELQGIAR